MCMKHLGRIIAVSILCLAIGAGMAFQDNYCDLWSLVMKEAGGSVTPDGMYVMVGGNTGDLAMTTLAKLRAEGVYDEKDYAAWKAKHGGQSAVLYYHGAANVISRTNQDLSDLQAIGLGDSSGAQFRINGDAYQQALAAQQSASSIPASTVSETSASAQVFTNNPEVNLQIVSLQQQYLAAVETGDTALQAQCLQLIQVLMAQNTQ